MAIDEKTRFELRNRFVTQMEDPDLADAVMRAMPPLDYAEFATKTDLTNLRTELRGDMSELRVELKGEMSQLRVEMSHLRSEVKGEMAELRTDFKSDIARLDANMSNLRVDMTTGHMTLLKWMFGMQFTSVAVLGGLITYLT